MQRDKIKKELKNRGEDRITHIGLFDHKSDNKHEKKCTNEFSHCGLVCLSLLLLYIVSG